MKRIFFLPAIFSLLYANSQSITTPLLNYLITQSSDQSSETEGLTSPVPSDSSAHPAGHAASAPDSMVSEEYRIEYGDVLEIVILGEEGLSRTLMVMHNGTISFPLVGEVKVIGLTTEEAAELLAEKLRKYFTHPVVSIILESPTTPYVSVFGEVMQKGAIEYQRGLRVIDYIALAGGPAPDANLGRVRVIRFQSGKPRVTDINVDEILKKGITDQNYVLKSGDWLYVPRKFAFPLGTVLQVVTLVVTGVNLYLTIHALY